MADLQPSEMLFIPNRRRLTHAKVAGPEGQPELHIFYGPKEIIFDEPDLMTFGDKLLNVDQFRADEAVAWSSEGPLEWERVRGLLEALLGEEILKRTVDMPPPAQAKTFPQRLGRAPLDRQPDTWSSLANQCPVTSQKHFGQAIDLGNLEVLLPVQRVAHPALDADGRQVGENNVHDSLFLDLPTDRRLCSYAGSRYHADLPMNSTALKFMVRRWPELLSLTEQFRTAFFARLPPQGKGLKTGEVHLLAVGCLASVGYVMVRGHEPVPNGKLDPGLAAMFRLIDGVRIVTTDLMRDTAGLHGCDKPLDAKGIHDYAEHHALFHDAHGVCAGPAALIDEYLKVLADGAPAPIQVEPNLAARIGDLEAALDYGFHGVRVESMARAFAAFQGQLHERLRQAFAAHPAHLPALQKLMAIPVDVEHYPSLRTVLPTVQETQEVETLVDGWVFARARAGLPAALRIPESLDQLRRFEPDSIAKARRQLADFFTEAIPDYAALPDPLKAELVAVAAECLALARSFLKAVGEEQRLINERLHRPQGRTLTSADFGPQVRRAGPFLERVLAEGLGLTISVQADGAVLSKGQHTATLDS